MRAALALLMALLAAPSFAAVQLQLDRDRVTVGETVTLTFLTDDSSQSLETDFSPLEGDFEILDRRSETQLSIVNGRQTAVVRLLLTVEPKHDGDIVIPAFRFGGEQTAPVTLRVDPAPELEPGELPPVFIEVELDPGQGPYYVHAQFGLVVRVFYLQNLTEAAISPPDPNPASVRLLQETPYQAERGGERYRVLERHYAIFPERSGELTIPAMELTGRLVERRASGIWQPTVRGRRVRAASEEVVLPIEPWPAAFTGESWQPARELKLGQKISSADALRVGEPVTRTVLVDAVGLEENMIVEPAWPEVENARIYPDQPQGITRDDGRWVLGHKEFRYAVVPEQEGQLLLPELKVDWWDTRSNRQRTATLPAHTVYVRPSALVPPPAEALTAGPQAAPAVRPVEADPQRFTALPSWALPALLVGWVLSLWLAWWLGARRRMNGSTPGGAAALSADETALLVELKRACHGGDRAACRRCLQRWLRGYGPLAGASLLEFAAAVDNEALRGSLRALDSDGYRRDGGDAWNGKTFWGEFESWRKEMRRQAEAGKAPLTDLYAKENRLARSR